jgi:CBS domain-containing protein
MNFTGTISALLRIKKPEVWSIAPDATVFQAIQFMAQKNVGALPVMNDGKLVGMFSERDYTRKIALKGKSSRDTRVREITSISIVSVTPAHTVEDCMRLMTDHRIRHLPVLEGENVVGIISIGDLVNWIICVQNETIHQMENYIAGSYPG